jgi:hypothetical protein
VERLSCTGEDNGGRGSKQAGSGNPQRLNLVQDSFFIYFGLFPLFPSLQRKPGPTFWAWDLGHLVEKGGSDSVEPPLPPTHTQQGSTYEGPHCHGPLARPHPVSLPPPPQRLLGHLSFTSSPLGGIPGGGHSRWGAFQVEATAGANAWEQKVGDLCRVGVAGQWV